MIESIVYWWLPLIAVASALWDLHTYADRQAEWERTHPGVDYVRGYRKKARKAEKIYRKYQQQKGNQDGQ